MSDKKRWVGVDVPYVNLIFHRECINSIQDLNEYLRDETEKVYSFAKEFANKTEKGKKNGRI